MCMENRNILCIDLKSFFASVECIERGLDPYTTPLVVCNPDQKGAITLAVTPYMKKFGVKGRTRVYNIDKNINYIKVPPRMKLYQEKSMEVINVYLDFVSSDDIHIYSIDECFLDVTNYLKLYNKTDYELALEILAKVKEKTGLTATAGCGPNMLLAKVSMDIEAKHIKNNIAKWTYDDIKTKLWEITPLSKMWGIGPRMEARLNKLGLYKIKDVACYDKLKLKNMFGVMGLELWEHTNGIDNTKISDLKNYQPKEKSISHSQVLFKDYYADNIKIIIMEMIDVLCRRCRNDLVVCSTVSFGIGYSKNVGGGFHHSIKLDKPTKDEYTIYKTCMHVFDRYYLDYPIRKVSIALSGLKDDDTVQLDLFESFEDIVNKNKLDKVTDEITTRFGKNSLLRASSLFEDSTIKMRNNKIGGHSA